MSDTFDHVARIQRAWARERPDLDVSPQGLIGRLHRIAGHLTEQLRVVYRRHGLGEGDFDVLATLRRSNAEHSLTPAGLMRSSMVTSGAITQRLDRLEARGLVTRSPSETDGRGVSVTLTDAGLRLIDEVLPTHIDTENRLLAGLSAAERDQLAATLRTLLESLGDRTD
jgi:DNA-binding MarR family transcriptional regulator